MKPGPYGVFQEPGGNKITHDSSFPDKKNGTFTFIFKSLHYR